MNPLVAACDGQPTSEITFHSSERIVIGTGCDRRKQPPVCRQISVKPTSGVPPKKDRLHDATVRSIKPAKRRHGERRDVETFAGALDQDFASDKQAQSFPNRCRAGAEFLGKLLGQNALSRS